jgi:DNA-binding NarL/FixJ family response regulator
MQTMFTSPIRVIHIEDYKIIRDGIEALLMLDPSITMVGQAANKNELLALLENIQADVLILDLFLDSMEEVVTSNGFEICRLVNEKYPDIKIIAHSAYDDASRVTDVLKAGASGFVSKKSGFNELIRAIKTVRNGQVFLCIKTATKIKNAAEFLSGFEKTLEGINEVFSPREKELLILLSEGLSSHEIGTKLGISERTVETHRKNMIKKLSVKNIAELIARASSLGILKK